MSDQIADLLTRIRNASNAKHLYVDLAWSGLKQEIVEVLEGCGFVAHYLVKEEKKKKSMRIFLKYGKERESVLTDVKRMSKPSLRRYVNATNIPRVRNGMGIAILSTSEGVLEGELARQKNVGGELLCIAW